MQDKSSKVLQHEPGAVLCSGMEEDLKMVVTKPIKEWEIDLKMIDDGDCVPSTCCPKEQWTFVKQSTLPDVGLGHHAERDFQKGECWMKMKLKT